MAVKYICRHCQSALGELDGAGITEARLGFHFLTPEERRDIVSYDSGGSITVRVICDYCNEALQANPELSLVASPLQ